jgi:hypothetical protein
MERKRRIMETFDESELSDLPEEACKGLMR